MLTPSVDALTRARLNELSSPPELVPALMGLCGGDKATPSEAARLIGRDSALSARLLAAVTAPVFTPRQERVTTLTAAAQTLGMETVRSLALAATVQQFSRTLDDKDCAWLTRIREQALTCATLGYQVARHTGSARPDEAYLAGLLHNIGQLVLSHELRQVYTDILDRAWTGEHDLAGLERKEVGIDHVALGATLLERWEVPTLLVDAVRYHQQDTDAVADAHDLVKTTALARALAVSDGEPDSTALHAAAVLFDLGPTATACIHSQATEENNRVRQDLTEPAKLQQPANGRDSPIGQELRQVSLLGDLRRHLQTGTPVDGIARCVVLLFGIRHMLCLQQRGSNGAMEVLPPSGADPRLRELTIPLERGRSVMAECLLDDQPIHTLDPAARDRLSVVDRQLQSQLPGDGLLCLPMRHAGTAVGVLVLGIRDDQVSALLDDSPLLLALAREAGQALLRADQKRRRQEAAVRDGVAAIQAGRDELLIEAGTPLSIMQNYLKALEGQIEHGHPAYTQLQAVNEEAHRLTRLLGADADVDAGAAAASVNSRVRRTARIAEHGGLLPTRLAWDLALTPSLETDEIGAPPMLQEILLNLLRLLAGQLTAGVTLTIRTTGLVESSGHRYIELLVEHTGPDFPQWVREQLGTGLPVAGHGSGGTEAECLNVALALLREAGGLLTHRRVEGEGTRLQVLIPPAS